ncbi:MAG TPA: hypothetical protein VNV16_12410 [Methylibium sp.]|nr:hypothetical protein [Methylibium sp.]
MPAEREDAERLSSVDDQATRTEGEFLADALEAKRRRALAAAGTRPGVCANCGEVCLLTAVYCDEDCRDDHERRVRRRALLGGSI